MKEREEEVLKINKGMHQVNEIYKVSDILYDLRTWKIYADIYTFFLTHF